MSTEYIHFTAEQKEAARQTDLVALLQSQGEQLKRSGKEYVWRDGSEKVTVRGNLWFHQYERIGGDAVDFVRRFYDMDFPQAVNFLLGNNGGTIQRAEPARREPPKPFTLPPRNNNMRRVYAYLLNRRGIDREVLSAFVHKGMLKAVSADNADGIDEERITELMNEKQRLTVQLEQFATMRQKRESAKSRLDEIYTILDGLQNHPMEYDDKLVRQIIECIVVESKEKIKVVFIGGTEIEMTL